jgi:hypothetical protein
VVTLCALLALSFGLGKPAQNLAKEVRAGDFYSLVDKKVSGSSLYITGDVCNNGELEGMVEIYYSICSEHYCLGGNVKKLESPLKGSCERYKNKITPRDERWIYEKGLKLRIEINSGKINEEHEYSL